MFLFYIARLEDVREDRSRVRRAVQLNVADLNEPSSWDRFYRLHHDPTRTSLDDDLLWQSADRVSRAFDLLAVAYDCDIIDRKMVDLMYLPTLWDFWNSWLRGFVDFERDRRDDPKHLYEMENAATKWAMKAEQDLRALAAELPRRAND